METAATLAAAAPPIAGTAATSRAQQQHWNGQWTTDNEMALRAAFQDFLVASRWLLVAGCKLLVASCRLQVAGGKRQAFGIFSGVCWRRVCRAGEPVC